MSLITRTYTFTDGTVAYGSQVESEIANIVNTLNNLNSASATWDIVKVVNASSIPLIADNSTGTTSVAEFRANGVTKVSVSSTGRLVAANSMTLAGTLTFSTTSTDGIIGSSTNDSAAAGNVGEYISASVLFASAVSSSGTTNWFDVVSISLTAGDWDVTGLVTHTLNSATVAAGFYGGIGTASGTTTTGLVPGDTYVQVAQPTSTLDTTAVVPAVRKSLASTTTIYLKAQSTFSVGTPKAYGRISARRVR